jgi:hypothetical protein
VGVPPTHILLKCVGKMPTPHGEALASYHRARDNER